MDMKDDTDKKMENPQDDNLINKNANPEWDSKREISELHGSKVDPLKPQFERNNLQANQEKRAGSGGAAMDPGRREDRQNNGNDNK